jgi:hypothetical protein
MKKGMIILSLLLLLSMLLSGCGTGASAGGGGTGGSAPPVMDIFSKIITLEYLSEWGITAGPINPVEGFTRLLIIILLFSLFFFGSMKLPFGKPIAITISLVLAIMTGIFIPGTLLLTIAATYGAVFSALLLAIPIVLLLFAYWFLKDYIWIRVIILGLTWYVLKAGTESIGKWSFAATSSGTAYLGVVKGALGWLNFLEWAVLILAVITLIQALFSLFKGKSADISETASGFFSMHKERKHRARTAELNDYKMEKKELRELEFAEKLAGEGITFVEGIYVAEKIENAAAGKKAVNYPHELEKSLNTVKKHYGKVNRRTWKLHKEVEKLRKQMKKSGQDIDEITVASNNLIEIHKSASDALTEAISSVEAVGKVSDRISKYLPKKSGDYEFLFASHTDPDVMRSDFEQLHNGLEAVKPIITRAKDEQTKATVQIEAVIAESRKLGVFD